MRYAKLENGFLSFAPKKIKEGDTTTYNPPAKMLIERGYKPLIESDPPQAEDGYHYELSYRDEGEQIVYVWTLVEDEPTADDILNILTGESE